jgi:hypothetical protein
MKNRFSRERAAREIQRERNVIAKDWGGARSIPLQDGQVKGCLRLIVISQFGQEFIESVEDVHPIVNVALYRRCVSKVAFAKVINKITSNVFDHNVPRQKSTG